MFIVQPDVYQPANAQPGEHDIELFMAPVLPYPINIPLETYNAEKALGDLTIDNRIGLYQFGCSFLLICQMDCPIY